jgi:hypothetical protein
MESLEKFIEINFNEFSNLGCSEVIECSLDEFDSAEIEYLKEHYRFDYKDICVYYVDRTDEIWVENMAS